MLSVLHTVGWIIAVVQVVGIWIIIGIVGSCMAGSDLKAKHKRKTKQEPLPYDGSEFPPSFMDDGTDFHNV